MKPIAKPGISLNPVKRCAIYTRKSSEEGLDQNFNSLDNQRESGESYIKSQAGNNWTCLPEKYDDGGFSGGTMDRPALQQLFKDIESGRVNIVVIYKLDRLSRSLMDFQKITELFDKYGVAVVSVTQPFDTSTSMGRLTLNMLLSFGQFEREIAGERIRDKIAAEKARGRYFGRPPLGYNSVGTTGELTINVEEAKLIRHIFERFQQVSSPTLLAKELNGQGRQPRIDKPWAKDAIYRILHRRTYLGQIMNGETIYPGRHEAIITQEAWDAVHTILAENYRTRANHTRCQTDFLLKGILRCGACGKSMVPHFTRKGTTTWRFYQCVRMQKEEAAACPVGRIPAAGIEELVLDELKSVWRAPEMIAAVLQGGKELLEEECSANGEHDCLDELTLDQVRAGLTDMRTILAELDLYEKNRLMRLVLRQVVVFTDHLDIQVNTDGLFSLEGVTDENPENREL